MTTCPDCANRSAGVLPVYTLKCRRCMEEMQAKAAELVEQLLKQRAKAQEG